MWQAKTIWTSTFICFYRNVPTADGRIISQDTVIHRRLPASVILLGDQPWDMKIVGRVTFLNESDDGSFFANVELDHDPKTLPPGLRPQVDFGSGPCTHPGDHCPHVCSARIFDIVNGVAVSAPEITFIGMHLGTRPAWPDLPPVT